MLPVTSGGVEPSCRRDVHRPWRRCLVREPSCSRRPCQCATHGPHRVAHPAGGEGPEGEEEGPEGEGPEGEGPEGSDT